MNSGDKELLREIVRTMEVMDYINPSAIPGIDLYIDQVTTFLDSQLMPSKRHSDDKAITKTMINNYVKSKLLPAPEKKKYSKEHVLTLIFVYYLKNFLSIPDIEAILNPLTERFFDKEDSPTLVDIYDQIFAQEKEEADRIAKDIIRLFHKSRDAFPDAPEELKDYLHNYSMICYLSFEIYIKKKMVETLIDQTIQPFKTEERKEE